VKVRTNDIRWRLRVAVAAGAVAAAALVVVGAGTGIDSPRAAPGERRDPCGSLGKGRTVPIATSKLIVEYNATDDDLGVHGAFDSSGWRKLCVYDPRGRPVLEVSPRSQLANLTVGAIFFESREPPVNRFGFRELKARFPEGRYRVRGATFDGKRLVGHATFSHDVPKEPRITAPRDGARVDPASLRVTWDDVTETVDGDPARITGYEVIVTKEQEDDPRGFSRPVYDVHLPPDRNSLTVPAEFFDRRSEYELEVLALERSGNQTISVRFFRTT